MAQIRAFTMPKWGIEMSEGTIAEWMVAEGDAFTRGQTLCLIETDKITNEVEAEYDAVVRRLLVTAGSDPQPVGALIAVFGDAAADEAAIDAFIAGFRRPGAAVEAQSAAAPPPQATPEPEVKAPPAR